MAKVLAEERKRRCVQLALQGVSYDEIAKRVGYANRGTAHRTVMKALRARVDATIDEHRTLELLRLNALQTSVWDKAMNGDSAAANVVLKIMGHRAKLLGLDVADTKPKDSEPVIIVQGTTEEYIAALQQIG